MNQQISVGVRRFAALGLAFAFLSAIYSLAIEPAMHRISSLNDAIRSKRELAGRLAELARASPDARAAASRSEVLLLATAYLAGDVEAIQLANLQAHLASVTGQEAVRTQSTRTLPAVKRDGITIVGLQVVMQTTIKHLQSMLHRLETGKPWLIVDALSITPANRGGAAAGAEDLLQVELRILAAVRDAKRADGP